MKIINKILTYTFQKITVLIGVVFLFSCGTGAGSREKERMKQPLLVFAAASLTDVLSEIIDSFEVEYRIKVQINLASSGTLARQIEQGGVPGVYISASKKWADYVDSLGLILPGYKTEIARNELVLIAPLNSKLEVAAIDSSLDFITLMGSGRLSVGDPSHVPAGLYAKQSLEYYGCYGQLDKKTLPAKDVRSALMVVELEEAQLGIVYRTDAQKSEKVKILNIFPEKSHNPIVYVAAVCNQGQAAKDFFSYLDSDKTLSIWKKYGFKK